MTDLFFLAQSFAPTVYPGLRDLFVRDRAEGGEDVLLRSGDPYDLDSDEVADLEDGTRTITILAIDVATEAVIGHVSMHRITTIARGTRAHVELMLVDRPFRGRGVSRPLLVSAIRRAAKDWHTVRTVSLTSEANRLAARGLYEDLGFVHRGSGNEFRLVIDRYPWRQADGEIGVDAVTDFTQGRRLQDVRPDALRDALLRACRPGATDRDVRLALDPIALCRYRNPK